MVGLPDRPDNTSGTLDVKQEIKQNYPNASLSLSCCLFFSWAIHYLYDADLDAI